jgi:hypothetical protein
LNGRADIKIAGRRLAGFDCASTVPPRMSDLMASEAGRPTAAGAVFDDKDVQERIVRRSKLDWVIVRPVILTDGPKTNAYRALVNPRRWTWGPSRART